VHTGVTEVMAGFVAQELLQALDLPHRVRIVEGDSHSGLGWERRFRLQWWASGNEPLRAALQQAKTVAYHQAQMTQSLAQLTKAWRFIEQVVISERWRQHLRHLIAGLKQPDNAYLRLAYRAAQQVWSRAARWQAIMPPHQPCPFLPVIALLEAGAWPLGCQDDSLWVFVWRQSAIGEPALELPLRAANSAQPQDYIFLSAQFRHVTLTARWEAAFRHHGWRTLHGYVNEEIAPPEVQLGERIRSARAVVGVIDTSDPDFGLPWWMFQELDYASACSRPAVLISPYHLAQPGLLHVPTIPCAWPEESSIPEEHEIWRWLQANAA